MRRAYVLLSGGVDSTTCLYKAWQDFAGEITAVSIDYGQRHKKEIEYARRSADRLSVHHRVLNIAQIIPRTMLTNPEAAVPNISYKEIDGVSPTYVPYRNGLLLSAVTSYVVGVRDDYYEIDRPGQQREEWGIYFGAHAEDAHNWAYPDCTPEFIGAMANAIFVGTYRGVRLITPLEWLNKEEIVRLGQRLGVAWDNTWSCYRGEELHCGTCPTCRARRAGFVQAGVHDPTVYAAAAEAA